MNKKNKMCKFIPFSRVLHKNLKKGKFREEFDEELSRLKLAHKIRLLRQKRKLTQKQVALKAQMPQSGRQNQTLRGYPSATSPKGRDGFEALRPNNPSFR